MKDVLSPEYKKRHNELLDEFWAAQKALDDKFEKLLDGLAKDEGTRLLEEKFNKFQVGDRVIVGAGYKNAEAGVITHVEVVVLVGVNDDYYADRHGPGQFIPILSEGDEGYTRFARIGEGMRVVYTYQPDPSPVKKCVRPLRKCYEASLTAE